MPAYRKAINLTFNEVQGKIDIDLIGRITHVEVELAIVALLNNFSESRRIIKKVIENEEANERTDTN